MKIDVSFFAPFICCLLVICRADTSVADSFPTSIRDQTGDQLLALMKRASDENMIVTDVRVRTTGRQLKYHASFEKNADGRGWVFLINIDRERLDSASREHADKGYALSIQRSASSGGKRRYTAIWTRVKAKPENLVVPNGTIPISGQHHDALRPLDEMVVALLKEHNIAGATVAVAQNGRLVYSRGFGYADVHTRQKMPPNAAMRIASISKPITAVAIMMLIEQGKLSLDTPVVPVLRKVGFPKPVGDERWNDVKVRHLLHHSGGWDRGVSRDPMFQVIEASKALKLKTPARQTDLIQWKFAQPLDFDPGEKYVYSNFGYCILGRLVAAVSGQRYSEWVTQHILTPRKMKATYLGKTRLSDRGPTEVRYHMQNTTTHSPFWASFRTTSRGELPTVAKTVESPYGRWDLEVMDSHGGWVSTASDLLRFVGGLDDSTEPLIKAPALEMMLAKPQLRTEAGTTRWYGCGWSIRSAGDGSGLNGHNIWHNGALDGTSTLLVRRWDGFSWAVLFNTDRSKNKERLSSLIDGKMHKAIDSIAQWP